MDNINININNNNEYEFIELIKEENELLEINDEAIKLLMQLKNTKLNIININSSEIINKILKTEIKFESKQNILILNKPIEIPNNNTKLILIKSNNELNNNTNNINNKLTLLSILISSQFILYNNDNKSVDEIDISNLDIDNKIKYQKNSDEKLDLENIKDYLPELIFIVNNNIINNNDNINNLKFIYKNIKYYNLENINSYNSFINPENYKKIGEKFLDGCDLFGILQNYIDYLNKDEQPILKNIFENILINNAKIELDSVFEKFSQKFENEIIPPISVNNLISKYIELQNEFITLFLNNTTYYLPKIQISKFIIELCNKMQKKLKNLIIKKINTYNLKYIENISQKNFQIMNELNYLQNISEINQVNQLQTNFLEISQNYENCLKNFIKISENSEISKNIINSIINLNKKIITQKLINISESIINIFNNLENNFNIKESNIKIEIEKLKFELENSKTKIDELIKEKNIINKNYSEIFEKFEKKNRENKLKENEYNKNLQIEKSNYKKMEIYYINQLKEKENNEILLENKINQINFDFKELQKNYEIKINELQRENLMLKNTIENNKLKNNNKNENKKSYNTIELFKNFQNCNNELKKNINNFNINNININNFNNNNNTTLNELLNKLNLIKSDIIQFCEEQSGNKNESIEKELKKLKDENEQIKFDLITQNYEYKKLSDSKSEYEIKYNQENQKVNNLNQIIIEKENYIKTMNDNIKIQKEKVEEYELKLAKMIVDYKMKEDEFDSMFMVIECILSKKKDKFENALSKLSDEVKDNLNILAKNYKYFK